MPPVSPQSLHGRNDPFTAGNFRVEIVGITTASFSQVQGLEASIDVIEYRAGNSALNMEKLPGLFKTADVILKRGLTLDLSLWNWIRSAMTGNLIRTVVLITLLDQSDKPVLIWNLNNAWPKKWTGPTLNAGSSEVAMEELVIVHEGIEMVSA